ncbi:MAG: hypothetical protein AAB676_13270 [Verrucomicrobiota bacterium]
MSFLWLDAPPEKSNPKQVNFVCALNVTYSLADQNFDRTKSLGIFNLSLKLFQHLAARSEFGRLALLSNRTLDSRFSLPARISVHRHDEAIAGKLLRIWWDQWGVYRAEHGPAPQFWSMVDNLDILVTVTLVSRPCGLPLTRSPNEAAAAPASI